MQSSRKATRLLATIIFALSCVFVTQAQVTTGNVRGVVNVENDIFLNPPLTDG